MPLRKKVDGRHEILLWEGEYLAADSAGNSKAREHNESEAH